MQTQMSTLTLTNQQSNNLGNRQGSHRQNGKNTLNPKTGLPWKFHSWSCGYYAYWGGLQPEKSGHKDKATFRNRMNGSNKNCL